MAAVPAAAAAASQPSLDSASDSDLDRRMKTFGRKCLLCSGADKLRKIITLFVLVAINALSLLAVNMGMETGTRTQTGDPPRWLTATGP